MWRGICVTFGSSPYPWPPFPVFVKKLSVVREYDYILKLICEYVEHLAKNIGEIVDIIIIRLSYRTNVVRLTIKQVTNHSGFLDCRVVDCLIFVGRIVRCVCFDQVYEQNSWEGEFCFRIQPIAACGPSSFVRNLWFFWCNLRCNSCLSDGILLLSLTMHSQIAEKNRSRLSESSGSELSQSKYSLELRCLVRQEPVNWLKPRSDWNALDIFGFALKPTIRYLLLFSISGSERHVQSNVVRFAYTHNSVGYLPVKSEACAGTVQWLVDHALVNRRPGSQSEYFLKNLFGGC